MKQKTENEMGKNENSIKEASNNRKTLIFFLTWFHWFFWQFWWFHEYFLVVNLETMVVSWSSAKKKLKPLGHQVGPEGRSGGPRAQPDAQMVSAFFLPNFMNTTMVSRFTAKSIREYHQNCPKNQWIPGHKNKKICRVFIEILHWWYLGQKYSFILYPISVLYQNLPRCSGNSWIYFIFYLQIFVD